MDLQCYHSKFIFPFVPFPFSFSVVHHVSITSVAVLLNHVCFKKLDFLFFKTRFFYYLLFISSLIFSFLFYKVVFLFPFCSWPVRTLSFSHDGEMLASGSEDLIIDIVSIILLVVSGFFLISCEILVSTFEQLFTDRNLAAN